MLMLKGVAGALYKSRSADLRASVPWLSVTASIRRLRCSSLRAGMPAKAGLRQPRLLSMLLVTVLLQAGKGYACVAPTNTCAATTIGRGILASSQYPSNPPSGQICQWTITAFSNKVIALHVADFDLSSGAILEIYDGSTVNNETWLTSYTGMSASKFDLTLGSVVTLVFRSSVFSLGHRGFLLMYYSIDPPQRKEEKSIYVGEETLVGGGSLRSPGYGGWYPNSALYTWTLRSCEDGAPMKLVFKDFSIESPNDRLFVYDGTSTTLGSFRSVYTGKELPPALTLGSVATLVFISDNMGSDRGFSAVFYTEIGSGVSVPDSDALARACNASCPTNIQLENGKFCYAHDDPHMRTFDGVVYEHQKQGIFYLYKHDTAPIWVQAAFQTCNSRATCSCAVGVRYWDELFVVDRCQLAGSTYRPNRIYKLGSGSMMSITPRGVGFMVSLPNGLKVVLGSSWAWIGTVDLYPALGDHNFVQGLCGRYNGNPSDDGTYRCGFNATSGGSAWDSWRVPDEEVVFTASMPQYAFNVSYCNCSHVPRFPLPRGVLDATGLPSSELSNGLLFDIDRSKVNDGEDRPWPTGWTQLTATQYCRNYIENNQAIRRCEEVVSDLLDIDGMLNDCVRDIYLTGGTAFALTALEASKERCIAALDQMRNTDPSLRPCPNDCSQRGQCVNGTCRCSAGFYGPDCTVNPGLAPRVRNSTIDPSCLKSDQIGTFCAFEQIFGESFYDVVLSNPKCKIIVSTYTLLPDGSPGKLLLSTTTTVIADYESPSAVTCRLPTLTNNSTGIYVTYTISVTNDGINYSNPVVTSRIFVPPCGGSRTGFGSITSPNFPLDYWTSTSCSWNLAASANNVIDLALRTFVLKDDGDSVQLFDQGCLIDRWIGFQPKQSYTYGPSLTMLFTSGASSPASGFNISFNSIAKAVACGGVINDRGTLRSPNYPLAYPKRSYCMWKLSAGPGKSSLSLQFNAFNVEAIYDYLAVYSGVGSACTYIDQFSGSSLPPTMKLGPTATVLFRTDDDIQLSGFDITVLSN